MRNDTMNIDNSDITLSTSSGEDGNGEGYVMYGESAALIVLLLSALVTNIPVILVYIKCRHIRTITDKFLLNLMIADIVSICIFYPTTLWNFIQYSRQQAGLQLSEEIVSFSSDDASVLINATLEETETVLNEARLWHWSCSLNNAVISGLATFATLAAMQIALERYLAVVQPLHYHRMLTATSIIVISGVCASFSAVVAILSALEPTFSLYPNCSGCIRDNLYDGSQRLMWAIYSLGNVFLSFFTPIAFMVYIYVRIYLEARRQRKKISKQYKPYFLNIPKTESEDKKTKGMFPIPVKFRAMRRLSVSRIDRAARVAVYSLFVSIVCWTPYHIFRIQQAFKSLQHEDCNGQDGISQRPYWTNSVTPLLLASLHPILAPVVYAYRYKRLRTEISKTIGGWISCVHHDHSKGQKGGTVTKANSDGCIKQAVVAPSVVAAASSIATTVPVILPPDTVGDEGNKAASVDDNISAPSENVPQEQKQNEASAESQSINIPEEPVQAGIQLMERSMSSFLNYLNVWVNSYSRRWLSHRESVTSTASFIALVSNKYHSKAQTVANV